MIKFFLMFFVALAFSYFIAYNWKMIMFFKKEIMKGAAVVAAALVVTVVAAIFIS